MKKSLKIFLAILYIAGIVVLGGFLVYCNFIDKERFPSIRNRYLITFIAAFVAGLVKLFSKPSSGRSLSYYKDFYADIIKDSFENDKKNQRKLLQAIRFYNIDKFEKSISYLNSIRPKCRTLNEKYCVDFFLAVVNSDCENMEAAAEIYQKMIDEDRADTRVFSNLSNLYNDCGDYDKAEIVGKKAIAYDPENYIAYNNLASCSFRNGDYEAAIEYAKKCLEIKNNFLPSIKLLYLIYSLEENYEEADLYAKKAVANGFSKKDLQEALKYFVGEDR